MRCRKRSRPFPTNRYCLASKGFFNITVCSRSGPTETKITSVSKIFSIRRTYFCALAGRSENLHGRERRIPPIHLFQDGLSALHGSDAGGKLLVDLAIVAVGDAHRDFLEAGQYIKLRQREAGDAADSYRMAHSHRVKPATAAWPAGGGAELDPFAL